jgi:hypothetical protein
MVRVAADTQRSRMPLRSVGWRGDEIENPFDGLADLDTIVNARHPQVPPVPLRLPRAFYLAANMHGEPNCFRARLMDSMFHMARNR